MDVSVVLAALIAVGAALAGGLVTWVFLRRRLGARQAALAAANQTVDELKHARDAAAAEAECEKARTLQLRADAEDDAREIAQLHDQLDSAHAHLELQQATSEESSRELRTFRETLSDIAGLEAEVAMLRVIAARVPHLEGRLAELDADCVDVDLRRGGVDAGIDTAD